MKKTLAFDVYGTLIDTRAISRQLETLIGDKAQLFSDTWRQKQLEYSFRRGLMKCYQDFSICTKQALDFTCLALHISLSEADKAMLLNAYLLLPAFADTEQALAALKIDCTLVAFSNGTAADVNTLLKNANIRDYFSDVISVDDIQTFKPSPDTYQHLLDKTHSSPRNTWLISSNPFDVIGADHFGINTAWIDRASTAIFDPWQVEPKLVCQDLVQLNEKLKAIF